MNPFQTVSLAEKVSNVQQYFNWDNPLLLRAQQTLWRCPISDSKYPRSPSVQSPTVHLTRRTCYYLINWYGCHSTLLYTCECFPPQEHVQWHILSRFDTRPPHRWTRPSAEKMFTLCLFFLVLTHQSFSECYHFSDLPLLQFVSLSESGIFSSEKLEVRSWQGRCGYRYWANIETPRWRGIALHWPPGAGHATDTAGGARLSLNGEGKW